MSFNAASVRLPSSVDDESNNDTIRESLQE
jgi:hypothetical protein